MGNQKGKDIASKIYLSKNQVFADLFNFFIYNGKPVIDPDGLMPLSTEQIAILSGKGKPAEVSVHRYRDILKKATIMEDDKVAYLVLGIESQSQIDYTIPIRNMLYDVLEYDRQVKEFSDAHREVHDYGTDSAEFLSGIRRGDYLKPVITFVLYLGAERWNAPKSLYELFPPLDESIKPFVNNYNVYVVEPAALSEEDYNKFKTDLGKILYFIKCSNSKTAMRSLLNSGKMKGLSEDGGLFLQEVTHTKLNIKNEKEEDAVCKAVDDLIDDGRREGHAAGVQKERLNAIRRMQERLLLTAEQAVDILGIPEEEQSVYLNLL